MREIIVSFEIKPCGFPACAGHTVVIVAKPRGSRISVRDTTSGVESTVAALDLLGLPVDELATGAAVRNTTRGEWQSARRRERILRNLLLAGGPASTRVQTACRSLKLSRRSVYRLLERYRRGATTASLVAGRAGTPRHQRRLSAAREAIIAVAIAARAQDPRSTSVTALVNAVGARCRAAGLRAVSRRAIERRLDTDARGGVIAP
jgi:hypothetical protein